MITRIVRMSFQRDKIDDFEQIFEASKEKIRAMPGCQYLSLHKDYHHPCVYYTLSHWDSQSALDDYRNSSLFQATWTKTKALFDERPSAYSLEELIALI